ncbi:MAG: cytochrome c oxidase subunit II [Parafilimonas terrae]|nr:cytochrome c oxidase subunit II [Parafilimonas terrae]
MNGAAATNGAGNALDIWPAAASASAVQSDLLILGFTVVILLLTVPIFVAITYFAFRYRQGVAADRAHTEPRSDLLELSWMIIPFVLTLGFFFWGAKLFSEHKTPPPGALQVNAIGRQWMWKFQYPGGQSEINNLHVPTGQPVLIRMVSQDVIHALYIPALRIQMDTLPGRYTEMWFKADKPGVYHLLCSEYCGTDHSVMGGSITIMTPSDYGDWLSHQGSDATLAAAGQALFSSYGCAGCHEGRSTVRAPSLAGLYGKPVPLEAGGTIVADDSYIRNKILNPDENKIAGYKQIMPAFKGVIAEDDMLRLLAYIKSTGQTVGQADDLRSAP